MMIGWSSSHLPLLAGSGSSGQDEDEEEIDYVHGASCSKGLAEIGRDEATA